MSIDKRERRMLRWNHNDRYRHWIGTTYYHNEDGAMVLGPTRTTFNSEELNRSAEKELSAAVAWVKWDFIMDREAGECRVYYCDVLDEKAICKALHRLQHEGWFDMSAIHVGPASLLALLGGVVPDRSYSIYRVDVNHDDGSLAFQYERFKIPILADGEDGVLRIESRVRPVPLSTPHRIGQVPS